MAISLEGLSETDLKRFAVCWLLCDRGSVDWDAAAAAYDPEVKVASFKTVTGKATSKALKAAGIDGTVAGKPKKAAAGGKRKKGSSDEGAADDGEEEAPKPKKRADRAKKAKSEEKVASDAEQEPINGEDEPETSD